MPACLVSHITDALPAMPCMSRHVYCCAFYLYNKRETSGRCALWRIISTRT